MDRDPLPLPNGWHRAIRANRIGAWIALVVLGLCGLPMFAIVIFSPADAFAGVVGAGLMAAGIAIFASLQRSADVVARALRDDPARITSVTRRRSLLGSGPERTITSIELADGTRAVVGGPKIEILIDELARLRDQRCGATSQPR